MADGFLLHLALALHLLCLRTLGEALVEDLSDAVGHIVEVFGHDERLFGQQMEEGRQLLMVRLSQFGDDLHLFALLERELRLDLKGA